MSDYEIKLSDNSDTITIAENAIDKDRTSIALVGHGQPNYGEPQNENFIHMLENFSSEDEPHSPLKGQMWFKQNNDGNTYELRICREAANGSNSPVWDKILVSASGSDEPQNPSTGDIWYDFNDHKFKVYDESLVGPDDPVSAGWNTIGPQDVIHNESDNQTTKADSEQGQHTKSFVIDKKTFQKNIQNVEGEPWNTGSLHLVTLKVLIKEVFENNTGSSEGLRSCAMIYRFVVRTIATGTENNPSYTISIFGAPNYEIIAKSDNLEFTTNLEVNAGNVVFTIDNQSTQNGTYFVNGIDMEITRV